VVAEGAVVKNNDVLEDWTIYVGVPAKARGKITEEYRKQWTHFKGVYSELAQRRYPQSLRKLKTYPSLPTPRPPPPRQQPTTPLNG